MNNNIFFESETKLSFFKIKWDSSELSLARCLNFAVDESAGKIICDIKVTTKNSLFEFLKKCFTSLVESPLYKEERDNLFSEIKKRYDINWSHFNESVLSKIKCTDYSFYNHQKEAMFYCYNKQYNLLAMDMGTGKAQPLDADIISEKGITKMGDIKVGDKIFAQDGNLYPVTHIHPQGEKDVYKISFSDGTSTECCDEHLWFIQDKQDRYHHKRFRVANTNFIRNNLFNTQKLRHGLSRWNIPKTSQVNFSKKENTIHPYLMGALLGNGCLRDGKVCFSSNDMETIEKISTLLPENTGIKKQGGNNYTYNIFEYPKKHINTSIYKSIFKYGLAEKLSHEKHIPDSYKFSSTEDRLEVLRGLLDTDGSVSKERAKMTYHSVSLQLINDVRFIVESLGGVMTIKKDIREGKRTGYFGSISLDKNIVPFTLKRKVDKLICKQGKDICRRIMNVELIGKKTCQCITVASPDHSYLTNNFIVTHNSLTSASLSRLWNCQRTLIICPSVVKWNWYRDLTEKFGFNPLFFTIIDRVKSKSISAYVDERFVIVNYEMIKKFWSKITEKKIDHIICDECHMLKNHQSARYDNVSELATLFPEAKITLLSGTPVKNRVNDMFAYLKLTKHPLGKNYSYFLREYTNTEFGRGGLRVIGSKNLSDLYSKLSNFMVRYRIDECVDLPAKIISKFYIDMEDWRTEYNKVIDEMLAVNEKFDIHGALSTLNIVVSKAKLPGIIQLAENIIDEGRKVVIFSSYHAPMDDLQFRFGESCVRVDGRIDAFEKDKQIQRFWKDDSIKVFLAQTTAAGVGINLTNCHDIIFANFPFVSTDMEQAISRCYRIGQKEKVKVYLPMATDSIDDFIYSMIVDKSADINAVVDRGATNTTNYASVENRLMSKLIERYKPEVQPTDYI